MPTIDQLSTISTVSAGDKIPVYSQSNGDARAATLSTLLDFVEANFASPDFVAQIFAPSSSGTSIALAPQTANLWAIINPTGAFATLTLVLPPAAGALYADGAQMLVSSTNSIGALTINGNGAVVVGAPTSLAANGSFALRFNKLQNTWFVSSSNAVNGTLPSLTLTSPTGGTLKDLNGAPILDLDPNYTAPAVGTTYLRIRNRNAGSDPAIQSVGAATDVGIQILSKGAGAFLVSTTGSAVSGSGGITSVFATTRINLSAPFINAPNLVLPLLTLSQLNAAALAAGNPYGMRGSCSDSATVVGTGNFSATFAGGGANNVPCWFDGTVWRIG